MSAAAGRGDATKNVNMRRVHAAKLPDRAAQHNRAQGFFVPMGFSCPGFVAHIGFVPHAQRERITAASVALTIMARYARPRVVATMYGCS
jgi:hypothetical protein